MSITDLRLRVILRYLFHIGIVLLASGLDVAVFSSAKGGVLLHMSYILIIIASLRLPLPQAVAYGIGVGLLIDLFHPQIFGLAMLAHVAIVIVIQLLRQRWFKQPSIAVWMVFSVIAMIIGSGITVSVTAAVQSFNNAIIYTYNETSIVSIFTAWLCMTIGVTIGARITSVSDRVIII